MKELIKVKQEEINSQQVKTVNARELHSFLKSKQDFTTWVKKRINQYDFVEDLDFVCLHKKMEANNATLTEYHLTLDMAKEISMVERNKKGKEARQYFIECERVAQQQTPKLPGNYKEALEHLIEQVGVNEAQAKQIEHDKPKVALAEKIVGSANAIKLGDFVKVISRAGEFVIGRNNFFKWLKFEQILNNSNIPYQKYINNGWLEVKESTYEHINSNGPRSCFTTLVTGRGQVAVLERFRKSEYSQKFMNKGTA